MKSIHLNTSVLIVIASLFSLISVATNYWVVNDEKTAGLFKVCYGPVCKDMFQIPSVVVAAIFITSLVEMLVGSVFLFAGWHKEEITLQKIGTTLVILGTFQYITGCGVFTWFASSSYPRFPHWGLSYALAWATCVLSLISSVLTIHLLTRTCENKDINDNEKPTKEPPADLRKVEKNNYAFV